MLKKVLGFKKNKTCSKIKKLYVLIILLLLIESIFIKIMPINFVLAVCSETFSKETYTHFSNKIVINLFNTVKNNRFKITANHMQYLKDKKVICFIEPEIIIFNKKNISIWHISCSHAKLIDKDVLDLCGYVHISKIFNNKYVESIITKRVLINLTDQNMISNDKTIIHGCYFYSVSTKMYVDFNTQIIKLFGKIYTQYEIKSF